MAQMILAGQQTEVLSCDWCKYDQVSATVHRDIFMHSDRIEAYSGFEQYAAFVNAALQIRDKN
jgi:hypothetical protein